MDKGKEGHEFDITYANPLNKNSEHLTKPEVKILEDYGDLDEGEMIYKTLILKDEEPKRSKAFKRTFTRLKKKVQEERVEINIFEY